MTFDKEKERQLARQARLVAVVFAMTIVLWMAGQWLGGELGWEVRYVFLFDMIALAGFTWGLFVTYQIWRKRRDD